MSSRSIGVMNVLCSRSTHACVMSSVSCSISLMRAARARVCPLDEADLARTLDRERGMALEQRRIFLPRQQPTKQCVAPFCTCVRRLKSQAAATRAFAPWRVLTPNTRDHHTPDRSQEKGGWRRLPLFVALAGSGSECYRSIVAVNIYQAVKQAMQDLIAPQLESVRGEITALGAKVDGLRAEMHAS